MNLFLVVQLTLLDQFLRKLYIVKNNQKRRFVFEISILTPKLESKKSMNQLLLKYLNGSSRNTSIIFAHYKETHLHYHAGTTY